MVSMKNIDYLRNICVITVSKYEIMLFTMNLIWLIYFFFLVSSTYTKLQYRHRIKESQLSVSSAVGEQEGRVTTRHVCCRATGYKISWHSCGRLFHTSSNVVLHIVVSPPPPPSVCFMLLFSVRPLIPDLKLS